MIDVLTADVQTSHGFLFNGEFSCAADFFTLFWNCDLVSGHAHSGVVARAYSAVDFGSCVRLTSLARSVVPPPMSASQIMISSPANQLAYLNHGCVTLGEYINLGGSFQGKSAKGGVELVVV